MEVRWIELLIYVQSMFPIAANQPLPTPMLILPTRYAINPGSSERLIRMLVQPPNAGTMHLRQSCLSQANQPCDSPNRCFLISSAMFFRCSFMSASAWSLRCCSASSCSFHTVHTVEWRVSGGAGKGKGKGGGELGVVKVVDETATAQSPKLDLSLASFATSSTTRSRRLRRTWFITLAHVLQVCDEVIGLLQSLITPFE